MEDVIDLYIIPLLVKYINRWTSKEEIPKARYLKTETNQTKPIPKVDLNDRDSYDVVVEVGMKDGKPYTKDAYRIDRASGLGYCLSKEDMCPSSMYMRRVHCPERVAFPKDVYFTQAKTEKHTDFTYEMEGRAICPRTLDEYYGYNTESRRARECYFHLEGVKKTPAVHSIKSRQACEYNLQPDESKEAPAIPSVKTGQGLGFHLHPDESKETPALPHVNSRRARECYFHSDEDKETPAVSNAKCCCTEDDRRRREAWNHYRMDYMGRDASDNIIQKIVDTINTRQYHPHTRKYDPHFLETFVGHHPYHYPSAEPPPPTFRIRKIIE